MKLFHHAQQDLHKIAAHRYSNILLFTLGFFAILILLLVAVKGTQDTRSEAKQTPGFGGGSLNTPTPKKNSKKYWGSDKYPMAKPTAIYQGIFRTH